MKKLLAGGALFAFPVIAFAQLAQGDPDLGNLTTLIRSVGRIIDLLLPIVAALALLYFFWGLAKFILAAGDEEAREKGKSIMIWGIVALFVLASVWGLVSFLGTAFGIRQGQDLDDIPSIGEIENL